MRCHVHVNFVVISLPTLAAKASANEHMIQMCHLDFVFLLLFPRNEMPNASLPLSVSTKSNVIHWSCVAHACTHAAGKLFMASLFFFSSGLSLVVD